LVIEVELASKEIHPLAGMVADLIDHGFLKSVSVGFVPKEWEEREDVEYDGWFPPLHFIEQELIELSVVSVPANPAALLVTNALGREQLYERGIVPGTVHTILFDDKFEGDRQKWLEEHDFKTDPCQRDLRDFIESSFKTITLAKGVKATIGKLKSKIPVTPKWATSVVTSSDNGTFAIKDNSVFNDERIVEAVDKLREENVRLFEKINTTLKSLAHLVEITSKNEDPPSIPDSKKSEGIAEEYLLKVKDQLSELCVIGKK
jgi:prohead serine protease